MNANHLTQEEEHVLSHLRSIPHLRRHTLLWLIERDEIRPQLEKLREALPPVRVPHEEDPDKEWERIQGDLWEMRGHLRNGRALDDEDFRGGHVAG